MGGDEPHRQAGMGFLDPVHEFADLHVGQAGGRDNHVENAFVNQLERFGCLGHSRETGCESEVEIEVAVLLEDQLGELSILLEDERIVVGSDEENLDDAVLHQRRELLGLHPVPAGQLDGVFAHIALLSNTVAEKPLSDQLSAEGVQQSADN